MLPLRRLDSLTSVGRLDRRACGKTGPAGRHVRSRDARGRA